MGAVVDTVGGLLGGGSGGDSGTVYQANQAPVPYTPEQIEAAQKQSLDTLAQQQAMASQLTGVNGVGNQQGILQQQQGLANQLQQQASGQGPNPAQIQFGQNLNAVTQQGAGTIASQKGISPALMADLIARQQAGAGQNAAASTAQMQAQQQLAAQQALMQQQAQMSGTAQNQVGNQLAGTGALTQATQNQQNMLQNANNTINAANLGAQQAAQQATAQSQQAAAGRQSAMMGGLLNAAGTIGGAMVGGPVGAAAGGAIASSVAPQSGTGTGMASGLNFSNSARMAEGGMVQPNHFDMLGDMYHGQRFAHGGEVGMFENVQADETSKPQNKAMNAKADYEILKAYYERSNMDDPKTKKKAELRKQMLGVESFSQGGKVPGEPKVDRNSYANDNVPALLSPGEIVIPLDVMNSKDPAKAAAKFVQAILDKKGKEGKSDDKAEFHAALKDAMKNRKKDK